jgi:hypothetical protein
MYSPPSRIYHLIKGCVSNWRGVHRISCNPKVIFGVVDDFPHFIKKSIPISY